MAEVVARPCERRMDGASAREHLRRDASSMGEVVE